MLSSGRGSDTTAHDGDGVFSVVRLGVSARDAPRPAVAGASLGGSAPATAARPEEQRSGPAHLQVMTFDGWVDHLLREMLDVNVDDWFRVRPSARVRQGRGCGRRIRHTLTRAVIKDPLLFGTCSGGCKKPHAGGKWRECRRLVPGASGRCFE